MTSPTPRTEVRFASGDSFCVAWHYAGTNGACVVMAGGTGVTKEPGTDRFAARLNQAGFSVLAIDFRRLGGSGGMPRQVVRVNDQVADYGAAARFARTLPEVDPGRVALWGFSLAGGHVLRAAAADPDLAAAIAQTPLADGPAVGPNALRHMTPRAALRLNVRGLLDLIGRRFGRAPRLVPLAGPRGTVASLTTPDGAKGALALDPDGRYPAWEQTVAAGSALRIAFYRPGSVVKRIACPLLVIVCEDDTSVLVEPSAEVARRAPRAELVSLQGDHYAPFMEMHEAAVTAQLSFLRRHLADTPREAPSREVVA
jgi:pimeloyl-ACP methyl ester carboxylesterase